MQRKLKPSYIANTGRYPSEVGRKSVQYESFLERNLVILLENDVNVKRIQEYPFVVRWTDPSGISRRYTPDLLVEYLDGRKSAIIEVKSRSEIRTKFEFLRFKYRAVKKELNKQGFKFRVLTEKSLSGDYYDNQLFLKKYKRLELNDLDIGTLDRFLECGPKSVNEFLDVHASTILERVDLLPTVWAAISQNRVNVDMTSKLTNASLMWSSLHQEKI